MSERKFYIAITNEWGPVWKKGFKGKITKSFDGLDFDKIRIRGDYFIQRALGPSCQFFKNNKLNFIHSDSGYFNQPYELNPKGKKFYHRTAVNAFQNEYILDVPGDRFEKLSFPINDWNTKGDYILLAPPSTKTLNFLRARITQDQWINNFMTEIKKHTDRPVKIRLKQGGRQERHFDFPLKEDLKNCHCVVTESSIIASEAVMFGTPACVLAENAAKEMCITDLKNIENPIRPDRTKWLHSLAYQQFTPEEIMDGTAKSILEETGQI